MGNFFRWYSDKIGHEVTIWGRENSNNLKELINTRKNKYLYLSENTKLTINLRKAVEENEIIIISISSQQLRNLLNNIERIRL